jgi:hypothetical protein
MADKATNAQSQARQTAIIEMLLSGYSRSDIVQYCANVYKIKARQTDVYIGKANIEIDGLFSKKKKQNASIAIARYNDLYKRSLKIQDYRECRQVQDAINKMLGINEPDRSEIKVGTIQPLFPDVQKDNSDK